MQDEEEEQEEEEGLFAIQYDHNTIGPWSDGPNSGVGITTGPGE